LDNYSTIFAKGVYLIRHDSLDQGISLLSSGIILKNNIDHKDRLFDYVDIEFSQLLDVLSKHVLNNEEQTLGNQFIKETITNGKVLGENLSQNIDKYLRKYPKSVFANRLKTYIYCLGRAPQEFKKLTSKLDKLLAMDNSLVGINLLKGEILYFEGSFKEGVENFTRVVRLTPDYAFAYNYRALCYNNLGLPDSAIADLDRAIKLAPDYAIAYNNRANTKTLMGLKYEAIADYKKAIEINPNFEWPYYNISLIYKDLNKPDSALVYNQDALDLKPNNIEFYKDRGDIYYMMKDYGQAINNYTKCINMRPENILYYIKRGNAYYNSDNIEQAVQDFERAENGLNKPYILVSLGNCYQHEKEFGKAIAYYDTAIQLLPGNKYTYISKALCYNSMDKNIEAKDCLIKALKIDSTYANALGNLGWVYYCLDDFDECIYYSKKAVNYDEGAYYAMFNIALATLRQGKLEESKALYRNYINYSIEHNTKVSEGAIDDLRKLIKKNILTDQATFILNNIFGIK
jgi:tetratricopeptide (TPR) repeat protein